MSTVAYFIPFQSQDCEILILITMYIPTVFEKWVQITGSTWHTLPLQSLLIFRCTVCIIQSYPITILDSFSPITDKYELCNHFCSTFPKLKIFLKTIKKSTPPFRVSRTMSDDPFFLVIFHQYHCYFVDNEALIYIRYLGSIRRKKKKKKLFRNNSTQFHSMKTEKQVLSFKIYLPNTRLLRTVARLKIRQREYQLLKFSFVNVSIVCAGSVRQPSIIVFRNKWANKMNGTNGRLHKYK